MFVQKAIMVNKPSWFHGIKTQAVMADKEMAYMIMAYMVVAYKVVACIVIAASQNSVHEPGREPAHRGKTERRVGRGQHDRRLAEGEWTGAEAGAI